MPQTHNHRTSQSREALIELIKKLHNGTIQDVPIHKGEPVLDPAPLLIPADAPNPKGADDQWRRLFCLLDRTEDTVLEEIVVRNGVPVSITVQAHPALDRYARALIQKLARRYSRKPGFSRSDEEDISQELTLHLCQQFEHFDPERGDRNSFVIAVLDRHAADLLRRQRAVHRNHRGGSLHTLVDDGDGEQVELAQMIGRDQLENRTGRWTSTEQEQADLAMDVADILEQLPENLRELAESLKHYSPSEIAKQRGITRKTVYKEIRELRTYFNS